jgi:hypothetical protein
MRTGSTSIVLCAVVALACLALVRADGLYTPADKVVEITEKSFPLQGVALIEVCLCVAAQC